MKIYTVTYSWPHEHGTTELVTTNRDQALLYGQKLMQDEVNSYQFTDMFVTVLVYIDGYKYAQNVKTFTKDDLTLPKDDV